MLDRHLNDLASNGCFHPENFPYFGDKKPDGRIIRSNQPLRTYLFYRRDASYCSLANRSTHFFAAGFRHIGQNEAKIQEPKICASTF
jgi:hypothetical protein